MNEEDKIKLDRALSLSEENNELLKKIYRSLKISRWLRIFYWVVIIGASLGALYYFQPLIDQWKNNYSAFQEGFQGLFNSS